MANSVAYTSINSPTGSLKKGVISINLNNQIIGEYKIKTKTMSNGAGIQELMAAETRASQIVAEARIGKFVIEKV
jgi:hypothetical protein